ncbi:Uncharacterised protein [Chlamydia trachomatis]|nr:Uncharacterised protein [Chlamydia trachomatis]
MDTCTYCNFPKDGICVTSICQTSRGRNPRGLTPTEGALINSTHLPHCRTISRASVRVSLNFCRNVEAGT